MRSRFADKFNHDEDAPGYDADVQNEQDPVRAGYNAVLNWVAVVSDTGPDSVVLDLGAGTGNLGRRLGNFKELVCVDVSAKMTEIGKKKLEASPNVTWVLEDLLAFARSTDRTFHRVVSTYALHHLTDEEKQVLFELSWNRLYPGGKAVFGDLMFADEEARETIFARLRSENEAVARDLEDEFPWNLKESTLALRKIGFQVWVRQFSELSWGIVAARPESA